MKVRIVDNLLDVIDAYFDGKEHHRTDSTFLALCERISGKEVDIYFVGEDAFEVVDDNYWLPSCCWTKIEVKNDN